MSRQNSLLERGVVFLQPQRINEKINNESIDDQWKPAGEWKYIDRVE